MMTESAYDDISVPAEPSDVTKLTAGSEQSRAKYMITVANPQKAGPKGSYVAYEVRSQSTGGSGDAYAVVRRYSDFLWLHDELQRHNPSLVIPPMPEKTLTGKFSPELLLFRSRELTRFLMRVSTHPKLCNDERFDFFVRATADDLARRRGDAAADEAAATATAPAESTPAPAKKTWFSALVRRAGDATRAVTGPEEEDVDPRFKEYAEQLAERNTALTAMLQNSTALVRAWHALGAQYRRQAAAMRAFAAAAGADSSDGSAARLGEDAGACDETVRLVEEFATKLEHSYHENIRDYLRENEAVQTVLTERGRLLRAYHAAARDAQKKPSAAATEHRDAARAQLDAFAADARADIDRVFAVRAGEIAWLCEALARFHRSAYKQLVECWALTCSAVRK